MMELNLIMPVMVSLSTVAGTASSSVPLIYWFYIEGLGFAIALVYFYHIFVKKGQPFYDTLSKLVDRAIIDDFYHKYLPRAVESTYKKIFNRFETQIVDVGYNVKLVEWILELGRIFRRIQTGKINHYLTAFILGTIILAIIIFGSML